jgi:hypothetical protein
MSVSKCLEAYLLWMFVSYMLVNNYNDSTDKVLISRACDIVDVIVQSIFKLCWALAVLSKVYYCLYIVSEDLWKQFFNSMSIFADVMVLREVFLTWSVWHHWFDV